MAITRKRQRILKRVSGRTVKEKDWLAQSFRDMRYSMMISLMVKGCKTSFPRIISCLCLSTREYIRIVLLTMI